MTMQEQGRRREQAAKTHARLKASSEATCLANIVPHFLVGVGVSGALRLRVDVSNKTLRHKPGSNWSDVMFRVDMLSILA